LHRQIVSRFLPYAPEQLLQLVWDVQRYPEFVPWVSSMRTWNQVVLAAGVEQVDAEAEVRFAVVRERFATRVRRDANECRIDVDLLYGPFRKLHNRWSFAPAPGGSQVDFLIEYEFRSRILEALLAANGQRAANAIIRCFEARARRLYDQPSGAQTGLG
jgi:coenzyme Q-binding protein COQ10